MTPSLDAAAEKELLEILTAVKVIFARWFSKPASKKGISGGLYGAVKNHRHEVASSMGVPLNIVLATQSIIYTVSSYLID